MKISIVTPSYNQGQYIEETINSILTQEGNFEIEYIIADGGSKDQTVDIIKKYDEKLKLKQFPIKCNNVTLVWWSKKDAGQPSAVNEGFEKATGEIIAWIASDDCYEPGAFAHAIRAFTENPHVGLIYGNVIFNNETNGTKSLRETEQISLEDLTLHGKQIYQPATFFTRELAKKVGYLDVNLQYVHDYDLWIKMMQHSDIKFIPHVFATFRIWTNSKTNSQQNKFIAEKKLVHIAHGLPIFHRKLLKKIADYRIVKILRERMPKLYLLVKNIFYKLSRHIRYQKTTTK